MRQESRMNVGVMDRDRRPQSATAAPLLVPDRIYQTAFYLAAATPTTI
jgi:hypothetical protein